MPKSLIAFFAVVLGIAHLTWADGAPPPYTADDFVTGYWFGPPEKFTTLQRYEEIRDANFTVAFPAASGNTPELNRRVLDFCQQLGMKAVVLDGRIPLSIGGSETTKHNLDAVVRDYGNHPALLAYHIADEPGPDAFPGLAEVNAYLKARDPRHPGYINLLPNHVPAAALGGLSYEKYVARFIKDVKPAWLSYDHYAMTESRDRPEFFPNLAIARSQSLAAGIPFWNIVLVTQHADYRHLTESELRYQAMQTIAFGGRGVVWFTYWSPGGFDPNYSWSHAMINPDGSRDPHYDMVKAINADVLAIGRELKHAESTAVVQTGAGAALRDGECPLAIAGGQLTVGAFQDGHTGAHFAVLANRDYKASTIAKFRLPVGAAIKAARRFEPAKRAWAPLDASGEVQLDVPAGGAVLIRW
jgi:hypothetical protein